MWPFRPRKKKEEEVKSFYSIIISSHDAVKLYVWKAKHSCSTDTISKRKIWIRQDKIGKKKVTTIKCDMCSKVHVL